MSNPLYPPNQAKIFNFLISTVSLRESRLQQYCTIYNLSLCDHYLDLNSPHKVR